jgi:methylmalonyl-CoA mutase cobalamin-binding domain/chain
MSQLDELAEAVIHGDSEKAKAIAEQIVEEKAIDLNEAIINGLNKGMRKVGELYEKREYFLPEIIVAADALYEAIEVFKPYLIAKQTNKATVVIGVVRGDIHDIGKNVVKIFLESAGYKVIDCGRNVPAATFVEEIKKNKAQVLALSTLMTPTLDSMVEVANLLKRQGLQSKVKLIIGGAAPDEKFAREIGAKFFADVNSAIKLLDNSFKR